MLAWSKAPRWEGLSRNTRGSHSTKHTVEHKHTAKHTVEHKHTGEKLQRAHWWCTLLWSTAGGASDGQRWSVAKTSIYPPLSDAIEHKFVKTLIYHKLSLPAGRVCSQLARMEFSSFLANSIIDFFPLALWYPSKVFDWKWQFSRKMLGFPWSEWFGSSEMKWLHQKANHGFMWLSIKERRHCLLDFPKKCSR